MKAILLNGPPRSGKDTVGQILARQTNAEGCMKFSEPIRSSMMAIFGIDMDVVDKDEPHPRLEGRTPREVAIRYSEGFLKPLFGVDYLGVRLGRMAASMIPRENSHVYVTDSGFPQEAAALAKVLGPENVLQVVLTRPGRTFANDSRSHWSVPAIGHIEFDNDCPSIQALETKLAADLVPVLEKWLSL